jgi:hypothetical protein
VESTGDILKSSCSVSLHSECVRALTYENFLNVDGTGRGGAKAVYVKPGGSCLTQDSGAGMGLLSFLASVVLLAAAAHPPPTSAAAATAHATSAAAGDSQKHPAGGKVPCPMTRPSSLSAAVAAVLREQLLPRTCTLLHLWRQPSITLSN